MPFSQYVVSRCLAEGREYDHFEDGAFNDANIRSLMQRVDAAPHPEMNQSPMIILELRSVLKKWMVH